MDEDSRRPRPLLKRQDREEILETLSDHSRRGFRFCVKRLLKWGLIIGGAVKLYRWGTGPKKETSLGTKRLPTKSFADDAEFANTDC